MFDGVSLPYSNSLLQCGQSNYPTAPFGNSTSPALWGHGMMVIGNLVASTELKYGCNIDIYSLSQEVFMGNDNVLKGFGKAYLSYAKWIVLPFVVILTLEIVMN